MKKRCFFYYLLAVIVCVLFMNCKKGINAVYTFREGEGFGRTVASITFKSDLTFNFSWEQTGFSPCNLILTGTYRGSPGDSGMSTVLTIDKAFDTSGRQPCEPHSSNVLKKGDEIIAISHGNILVLFGEDFIKS